MRRKSKKSSRISAARQTKRVETGVYFSEKYWLADKPYQEFGETDPFYFGLANEVYVALQAERAIILGNVISDNYIQILACNLTAYFEDKISDFGLWKAFIDTNKELYGYALPFYNLDEYDENNINVQDIRYLIWHRLSVDKEDYLAPTVEWISVLAEHIFSIFDKAKSKAQKNTAYDKYLSVSDDSSLYPVRFTLQWLATRSYLMGADLLAQFRRDLEQTIQNPKSGLKKKEHIYHTLMEDYGYTRRSSFSALSAPHILSRIVKASDETRENIKTLSRHIGLYRYVKSEENDRIFEHVQTARTYRITKKSIQENPNNPFLLGHTFFMSAIMWQGEWWLTGMMRGGLLDAENLKKHSTKPLSDVALWTAEQKEMAIRTQQEQYDVFIETFGQSLITFGNKDEYNEAMLRFQTNLRKRTQQSDDLSTAEKTRIKDMVYASSSQLPMEEFSVFFSSKTGMKMVSNIPKVIDLMEKENLTEEEKEDLFSCFIEDELPIELLQYLLDHHSTDNLQFSLEDYLFDIPKYLQFLRRFYHPIDFGPESNLPNIALANHKKEAGLMA